MLRSRGTGQSGIGNVVCNSCAGTGKSGYVPNINDVQREIETKVRNKLSLFGLSFGEIMPPEHQIEDMISDSLGKIYAPNEAWLVYVKVCKL